ncbi:MAG TPA: outer membrane lipoprotein-sorting protein [Nitrospirales bacterium]|nr:outer membrane lipoprotein-sorting protein [Nitrospirales bacterium]HIO69372.1 outer membrane lipoprotein-sorting protein [Nitrospirales bacterium]
MRRHTMHMQPVLILIILLSAGWASTTFAAPPPGATPEEQGQHVFVTRDTMDNGFTDAVATMSMTLSNAAGQTSSRKMVTRYFEVQDAGNKTLITFKFPRDIKGTGLLTFEHIDGADDQWLYLPALKRVKRIASKNKSGSFMGSEFSYEDIAATKPEKFTYKYIREDKHQGISVWIVERYPKDPNSGYTKIVSWVDQSNFQVVKQEFFDRKGSPLKFEIDNRNTVYLEKFWRPSEIIMENLQTKKKTTLTFSDWGFQQGQKSSLFSKRSLERQR